MSATVARRPLWPWLAVATLVAAVYLLQSILLPFLLACGLSYIGDPLVDWLERRRISRGLAVTLVFAGIVLISVLGLALLIPLLQDQLLRFAHNLPGYVDWIYRSVQPWLAQFVPLDAQLNVDELRKILATYWKDAGGVAANLFGALSTPGMVLINVISMVVIVPVVTFYMLRDWDHFLLHLRDLIPRRWLPVADELAHETDEVLSAFLRGQVLVMLGLGIYYGGALSILGLDLGLLIGIVAGLISFVPYLGFIVGLLCAGVAILVQTQELIPLLWVLLIFGMGQVLEGFILTPLLVGDRIGLHPVAVIFAVLAGGAVFGFVGVLLALPVAAVLAVFSRFAARNWKNSRMYQQGSASVTPSTAADTDTDPQ